MKRYVVCLLLLSLGALLAIEAGAVDAPPVPTAPGAPTAPGVPTAPAALPKKASGPFGGALRVTLDGTIKNLQENSGNRRVVGFDLVTEKETLKVYLARQEALKFRGLSLHEGDKVTVTGWQLPGVGKQPSALAGSEVTVGGTTIILFTPDNKPTWSAFDLAPQITLEGTVTKPVQIEEKPADTAKPVETSAPVGTGDAPKTEKPATTPKLQGNSAVSFVLQVNDKDSCHIEVCPAWYAQEIGLHFTEGGKATVTGWKVGEGRVTAREITLDGKVYTLRAPTGKQAWSKPRKPNKPIATLPSGAEPGKPPTE